MSQTTSRTSAQPIPTTTAPSADKRTLQDAAHFIGVAQTSLDWMDSVLHAIEVLNERGGGTIHIKYLADLRQYIISDVGSLLDSEREKFVAAAKAGRDYQGKPAAICRSSRRFMM